MKLLALTPLFLSALVSAYSIHGSFVPSALLPNPALLPPSTSLTLTTSGTTRHALVQRDNKFVFRDVPEGSYLLDVQCPTHHFGPLRVDVDSRGDANVYMTFRGNEWSNMGEKRDYPIELQPMRTAEYYVVREGFNPTKLLANPMILVAIVSFVAIVGLPKLVEKMDPELKAEFAESQRKAGSVQSNPLGSIDVAGFLAGKSSPDPPAAPAQSGKGKGKKN
ncbi:hypothetical protein Q9L58_006632 [Maublancomyces gigas]|uniref:ER membrane protein complex subunit 7 beta-sandwich domain-containing protein n=1 Tax=Discina gigas TaxID=1032678 RepID=A0ABR3GER6_9PEZI